jgi:Uma2 family endonuclease
MPGAALQHVVPERHAHRAHDPTFYPTEEKVGQDTLQMLILELLRPLTERWYQLRGKPTFVGEDQFIYYKRFHPEKVVAPDLYVLPGVKPGRRIKSWKAWKTGIVPSFALEVVSADDTEKDYVEVIDRYAELGVDELIVFDPDHERSDDRVRWQRYRKLKTRGFVQVESSNGDRLRSRVLGCFVRMVGSGDDARLRLATGPAGDDLVPTEAEAERAAKEQALAAKEQALAARDAERAAKEQALLRVAELEATVARLSRQGAG